MKKTQSKTNSQVANHTKSSSGEGGIRTRGTVLPVRRFSKAVADTPNDTQVNDLQQLPFLGCTAGCTNSPNDPELALLLAAWPTLPEPIRRAMLAMIDATAFGGALR